jgi:plasmid stabilization system protein ParE
VFHGDVAKGYNEAYNWYENQQADLGVKFLAAIRDTITRMSAQPEAYGAKTKAHYREIAVIGFPFVIVYRIYKKDRMIFISSVHHQKKHPRKKFRK